VARRHPGSHPVSRERARTDREHVPPEAHQQDTAAARIRRLPRRGSLRAARQAPGQPGTGRDPRPAGERDAGRRETDAGPDPRVALRSTGPGRPRQCRRHPQYLRRTGSLEVRSPGISTGIAQMKRYEKLADEIAELIRSRVLGPGERIPSVRPASRTYGVSPSTVFQAYYLLEDRGLIQARARSGYFVREHAQRPLHEPDIGAR